MKKILAILAALTVIGITLPSPAEAYTCGQRRVVSYSNCGHPVYAVYQVVGYDRCGNPIGQWVTQGSSCSCRHRYSSHGHHHSDRHHHHRSRGSSFGASGPGGGFFFRFGR